MTGKKKITRHTIENADPLPFNFIGVVSAEPDYRLSVMINRHLGINLRKCQEEIVITTTGGSHSFSRFTPEDNSFTLISNRSAGSFLLRRLKNIDFFIVPARREVRKEAEIIAASLRHIPEITAVFLFNSSETGDRGVTSLAL
jgi:hypothetical protein